MGRSMKTQALTAEGSRRVSRGAPKDITVTPPLPPLPPPTQGRLGPEALVPARLAPAAEIGNEGLIAAARETGAEMN